MSRELYFYRVKRIDEALPEEINIDETPIDYAYTDETKAAVWEKEIGQRCLIKQRMINLSDTVQKIFGKPAKSMQYMYCDEYKCFDENGGLFGILTREMMEPYYYIDEKWSYVYDKKQILEGTDAHIIETAHSGILNYEELLAWAEEATAYIDEYYSGECYQEPGQTLFSVMKAALCVKAGEMIYCYVD